MNNIIFHNIIRFVLLILTQVLICNQMNFLGTLNPSIYVLFILLYPINSNRLQFLIWSFLLGIIIDQFLDTGGIHAAASVTMAYVRPFFLKFSFGSAYEYQAIKLEKSDFYPRLSYFGALIFVHHFIAFFLIFFDTNKISLILSNTLSTGLFTLVLCLLISALFRSKTS